MRWPKSSHSSSSPNVLSSSSSTNENSRPKSFHLSNFKGTVQYHDIDIDNPSNGPETPVFVQKPTSKRSKSIKGSLNNLDIQKDKIDLSKVQGNLNPEVARNVTHTESTPGWKKQIASFSRTISKRFGSTSNMNKAMGHKSSKSKVAEGSSPDLHCNREGISAKSRSEKNIARDKKCESTDSGVSFYDSSQRLQFRSDQVGPLQKHNSVNSSLPSISAAGYGTKMSLVPVEIPNQEWEGGYPDQSLINGSCERTSDYLSQGEAGFSSTEDIFDKPTNCNKTNAYYNQYHSLPHKATRKKYQSNKQTKRIEHDKSLNFSVEGRSRSLEDEENPLKHSQGSTVRDKVIQEIIKTEQSYVKTLSDIVKGFLIPCRKTTNLFSDKLIKNIFSNIQEILQLHIEFLQTLMEAEFESLNVGKIFIDWADKFILYSEYCSMNSISAACVKNLTQDATYTEFFEACRRLQLMDKLPLHGFLLRPIQRICQYHLQLSELLKHTEESHKDYQYVVDAVRTMKNVAKKINDTQEQFEAFRDVLKVQNSIEAWEGPDLIDRNRAVLAKGDLVLKFQSGKRQKDIFCALLHNDLVYCKKDIIKKGGYVLEGRIDLVGARWINIDSNEEDEVFGMVHNSWRIYSHKLNAWILFTAPTPAEKKTWIAAFKRAFEEKHESKGIKQMREKAKMFGSLSQEKLQPSNYSSNSNTLPKSKKSKHKLTQPKIDPDAMLEEVCKLKKNSFTAEKDRTSRFYV